MPNRILKETVCTSPEIEELSDAAESLFYRLMVTCDDFGRFDARPAVVASKCYPLRRKMTNFKIGRLLAEIIDVGLAALYSVEGRPYSQIVNWSKHQRVRASASKFPALTEGSSMTSADICCQMTAGCGELRSSVSNSRTSAGSSRRRESKSDSDSDSDSKEVALGSSGSNQQKTQKLDNVQTPPDFQGDVVEPTPDPTAIVGRMKSRKVPA